LTGYPSKATYNRIPVAFIPVLWMAARENGVPQGV
jgi:hypothetical protein